jgi:hypothetical protein
MNGPRRSIIKRRMPDAGCYGEKDRGSKYVPAMVALDKLAQTIVRRAAAHVKLH